jgi:uncharacterized protein with ParB-like and HNH nuclease domain
MGTIKSDTIKNTINRVNESVFVPDIQRTYVWLNNPKDRRIELLFDSLMRGYPIGAFLFWSLKKSDIETDEIEESDSSDKLNFQLYKFIENYDERNKSNERINVSQVKSSDLDIVLDGQQRLTSLYIGLRGSRTLRRPYARSTTINPYDQKFLYLNLDYRPNSDNPEDVYQFEFKTLEDAQRANANGAHWFRVSRIMGFENRKESIRNYCANRSLSREAEDMITDLFVAISEQPNVTYFEETEKSLDKVLNIFIRVNSGGMQLSRSDLLMSLLTATFGTDIKGEMEVFVKTLQENGFGVFSRDHILKTCLMLTGHSHVFKLANFSKSNIRAVETQWKEICEYISITTRLLASLGYRNGLSSGYVITAIAYYLYNRKINKPSLEDKEAIAMFVRIAQLRAFFSAGLDGKLTKVKEQMDAAKDFKDFLELANKNIERFKITPDDVEWYVENEKYGYWTVLPLLQLLYPNLNYSYSNFHIDHIYPKSKFNKDNVELDPVFYGKANDLFNLQLLEGIENEEKSSKDPESWLNSVYKEPKARKEYLSKNYIPKDFILDWKSFGDFEIERKKRIRKKLYAAFNLPEPQDLSQIDED